MIIFNKTTTHPLNINAKGNGGQQAQDDTQQDKVVTAWMRVHDDPKYEICGSMMLN